MTMPTCAFLSTDSLEGYVVYDELARPALAELGWSVETVPWRSEVDWATYDLVILRSCWDYQRDADRFLRVLERIDAATLLQNPLEVVRWNLSKDYLRDLEAAGVATVPTRWQGPGQAFELDWLADSPWDRLVVKPVVSANAEHTFLLHRAELESRRRDLEESFAARTAMVQPFMPAIAEEGEYSLFYFGSELSHAIVKRPALGDFRVQEEHGGRIEACSPTSEMTEAARRALDTVGRSLLYARIDLVRDHTSVTPRFLIMELELIEPSLYFPFDEASPSRFARAVDELRRR